MKGRFYLDRRIFRYFAKPYNEVMAWIWLIGTAKDNGEERGKVYCTWKEISDAWGWSEDLVQRTLQEWEDPLGRIMIENVAARYEIVITLLNYDKYQTGDYSDTPSKERKRAPTKPIEIQVALDNVDLAAFQARYGERIDVNQTWERFKTCVLYGNSQKPKPNPYRYKDMTRAFHTWCKRAPEKPKEPEMKWCYDLPDARDLED